MSVNVICQGSGSLGEESGNPLANKEKGRNIFSGINRKIAWGFSRNISLDSSPLEC